MNCAAFDSVTNLYLHGTINFSSEFFFSLYSQPISKFNTPFEGHENVDCTAHNELKLKRC